MQWAKREDALVYKGCPVRNITCTIHENIPANIFAEGELDEKVVVAKFATTTPHGAIAGKMQEQIEV